MWNGLSWHCYLEVYYEPFFSENLMKLYVQLHAPANLHRKNRRWFILNRPLSQSGCCIYSMAQQPLLGQGLLIIEVSWSHSVRHSTFSTTLLDEWPARRRDLYLTTHNNHKRQTSMFPAGFEPAVPASERPQTHALDRAATGTGFWLLYRRAVSP